MEQGCGPLGPGALSIDPHGRVEAVEVGHPDSGDDLEKSTEPQPVEPAWAPVDEAFAWQSHTPSMFCKGGDETTVVPGLRTDPDVEVGGDIVITGHWTTMHESKLTHLRPCVGIKMVHYLPRYGNEVTLGDVLLLVPFRLFRARPQ